MSHSLQRAIYWGCEACGAVGKVEHNPKLDAPLDVYAGVYAVKDSHAVSSPDCVFDAYKVRVSDAPIEQLSSEQGAST